MEADRFVECPESHGALTQVCSADSLVDGTRRCVIDTLSLKGVQFEDAETLQGTVLFLRSFKRGINAFAVVINGQDE
jgi:hypothetical protein